jgi:Flp pilus assembly protein TadG
MKLVGFSAKRLRGNERGAAIMELALVAPILMTAIIGVVDIANAFSQKLALEQGAQRAIEKIMQTTQDSTIDDTVKAEAVCQVNGTNGDGSCKTSPLTASNVTITYRLECTTAGGTVTTYLNADAEQDCGAGLKQAQYVSVAIQSKYSPMFPFHFAALNADGTYHISATAGMRTQ